jgi:molecular chaperone GrpE (heat shock protein)
VDESQAPITSGHDGILDCAPSDADPLLTSSAQPAPVPPQAQEPVPEQDCAAQPETPIQDQCPTALAEERPAPAAAPAQADVSQQDQDSASPIAQGAASEQLTRAELRLEEALALAQRRDELVDRLHRENQQLRQGELQSAMLPLLRDLMRLLDDLEQILQNDPEARDLDFVRGAIEDILSRHGICGFTPKQHDPFDSTIHAAIGTVPASHPQQDRTICAVRRKGFRRDDGSIVRAADVTVYRHRPGTPADLAVEPSARESAGGDATQNIDKERT